MYIVKQVAERDCAHGEALADGARENQCENLGSDGKAPGESAVVQAILGAVLWERRGHSLLVLGERTQQEDWHWQHLLLGQKSMSDLW